LLAAQTPSDTGRLQQRRQVTLDVHNGGHFIPHGWIARQLGEHLGLKPTYP